MKQAFKAPIFQPGNAVTVMATVKGRRRSIFAIEATGTAATTCKSWISHSGRGKGEFIKLGTSGPV